MTRSEPLTRWRCFRRCQVVESHGPEFAWSEQRTLAAK